MPVSYKKLFELMKSRNIKKYDLQKMGMNPKVISALSKNANVNIETIMKLCEWLNCQPDEILEYVPGEEEHRIETKDSKHIGVNNSIGNININGPINGGNNNIVMGNLHIENQ